MMESWYAACAKSMPMATCRNIGRLSTSCLQDTVLAGRSRYVTEKIATKQYVVKVICFFDCPKEKTSWLRANGRALRTAEKSSRLYCRAAPILSLLDIRQPSFLHC